MSEEGEKLKVEDIKPEVLIRAIKRFYEMFPDKTEGWFEKSKARLEDVEYMGKKRGLDVFKVWKNPELGDNYKQKYRKVHLGHHNFYFCTCYYAKYGQARRFRGEACTHIGAAILFRLVKEEMQNEMS